MLQRVYYDFTHEIPRVPFLVGGQGVPRGLLSGGGIDNLLVQALIIVEIGALGQVAGGELPVFSGVIDALQKALFLLVFGHMQEDLHHAVAVLIKILLVMADLAVALGEKLVLVLLQHTRGHLVAFLQVVQLDHQHILVVAAVENGDGPAGGQRLVDPPQEVVFQLFAVGLFKTGHLHALGVQAGHHMFDGAVLAGGVHGLQNEDQSFAAVGIKGVLQSGHFL